MHKKNVLNVWTALACVALLWPAQPAMAAESVETGFPSSDWTVSMRSEPEIDTGQLSGIVVAVARHGEVVQRLSLRRPGTREKLRDDAFFRLSSMTKPVPASRC